MPSYAAAGLLQNLPNRLGLIQQALMGIEQRDQQEAEMARQAQEDAANREYRALQTEALRRQVNAPAQAPTPFEVEVGGVRGRFATPDDALRFRDSIPQPTPRLRGAGNREFEDTPEGREAMLAWEAQHGAANRAPQEAPKPRERRTGFRRDGALVDMDTGEVISAGVPTDAGGGAGSAPELTQDQGKSVSFYQRGAPALDTIERFARQFGGATPDMDDATARTKVSGPGGWGRALGGLPLIGNSLKSPDLQMYDQAVNDFAMAVLRKDSGATITDDEREFIYKTYIPQVGDDPATARQKLDAAARAIESFRATAGPGVGMMTSPPAPGGGRLRGPLPPANGFTISDDIEEATRQTRRIMGLQ